MRRLLVVERDETVRCGVEEVLDLAGYAPGAGYRVEAVGATAEAFARMDSLPQVLVLGRTERVEDAWEFIRLCYEVGIGLAIVPHDFREVEPGGAGRPVAGLLAGLRRAVGPAATPARPDDTSDTSRGAV